MPSENRPVCAAMLIVSVRWNGSCLATRAARGRETVWLGDAREALAPLPEPLLGCAKLAIASARGGAHALVPEGKVASIQGKANGLRLVAGPARVALSADDEATLLFGDFAIVIAGHAAEPSIRRRKRAAAGAWLSTAIVAAVHAGLLFAGSRAALASSLEAESEPDLEKLRSYLASSEDRTTEADAVRFTESGSSDAAQANGHEGNGKQGGGERHKGETGAAGTSTSRATNHHWGATTEPWFVDSSAGVEDLETVRKFGMVALLGGINGDTGHEEATGVARTSTNPSWGARDPFAPMGGMLGRIVGEAGGSFGLALSGIGEGGGGRGEGIGLGTIGTIGHADGLPGIGTGGAGAPRALRGFGIGDGHWGRERRPIGMWSDPTASVSGRLPPESVRRIVRANFGRFRGCYEDGLRRNPALSGRVGARFVIGRDGAVSSVGDGGSDLPDDKVKACVLRAFYGLSFPQPEGGIVTVLYPITFSKSE